ncbi:MAG: SDR family NAD(P)-dependent oxidoreductase [Rhodobacterales bacterium]|jgi:NAD(P)-dependent dehydrogenase (short-subunit alcohol dehydrogenase family)
MTELLTDKVCIITGAGKGFGKAIAKKFADNGAKLALITRTQSDIDDLYREFYGYENKLLAICGDVSDQDTVNSFVAEVKNKFGRIDVLVNNAGMRFRKKFEEITLEEFSLVLNVNVVSMFMLCKAVMPTMVEQRTGKIINISSVVGTLGLPELSAYATSKAAIIGLTKALSVEYGESNIQVNAIAPGFCKTSYFDNFKKKSELYEFTIERTPMRRWGESEEVANSCLFLASSLSSYVTGDVINVDGGWSAW